MPEPSKRIVVAGDAAVDWFFYPVPAKDQGENRQLSSAARPIALPGGALLLSQFTRAAANALNAEIEVIGTAPPGLLTALTPDELVHSNATFAEFKPERSSEDGSKVLRVKDSLGLIGPDGGGRPAMLPESNVDVADVLLLDDANHGFRDRRDCWPAALNPERAPLVVHKMVRPLAHGALWDHLVGQWKDRHLVIIRANDLRAIPGVALSKSLSWERTAKDFYYQIQINPLLQPLQLCPFLIVLFGTDAAIIYRWGEVSQATLVFDPSRLEGGFAGEIPGTMVGLTSALAAMLSVGLALHGPGQIEALVKCGLGSMRALLRHGFVVEDRQIGYPTDAIFSFDAGDAFATCRIERPSDLNQPDPGFWRVLDQKTQNTRKIVAQQVVRQGSSAGLAEVPVGKFGDLQTIDRAEIEGYSAIRALIAEFLKNPEPARPLCFAVFGPPGSGKSFGVKQVLRSIGSDALEVLTFNVSQFLNYQDLVAALHKVQDVGLSGKIPFVFLDEFDAANDDGPLGWLKYFLAPMQDGEFRDAGDVHPLGNAILVFAGGTCDSFQEFSKQGEQVNSTDRRFRNAKGSDFVSRLRGFINVMGPNRQGDVDEAYIIRRAKTLRNMLGRYAKAKHMFTGEKLAIDDSVLRALLNVSRYKHGIRSIEAILDMSTLAGQSRFALSELPPKEQLDLHVDAEEFMLLAGRERFSTILQQSRLCTAAETLLGQGQSLEERETALVEAAAEEIHERYRRHRQLENQTTDTTVAFDELDEETKNSNRDAAADIPHKLMAIQHGIRPIKQGCVARTPDISDEEVQRLAALEHDRWCREQRLQGYSYAPRKIPGKKVSPYLRSFAEIPPEIQQYDVQAIYALPAVLAKLGFELFRMEEVDDLDDPVLLESLARAVHEDYTSRRKAEGDTPATNPSLVEFDELPGDLRAANFDNAATIPRKLLKIGYRLHRVLPGEEPARLELTDEEIREIGKLEHARWNWQKILQGWIHAPGPKDAENKTSPYLVPWCDLPAEIQEYDLETSRLIPELIHAAGYEANLFSTSS